jgi:hypothetical protein
MEQIGDERAFARVEKLIERPANTPEERRVREAAERCVPALLARTGSTQCLLRAAHKPAGSVGDLLRPAADTAQVLPDQLLRPGELSDA